MPPADPTPTFKRPLPWLGLGLALAIALVALGYRLPGSGFAAYTAPDGTFHPGKTAWDWLDLLIIPLVVAVAGFWLDRLQQRYTERTAQARREVDLLIAAQRQSEQVFQQYLEAMTGLIASHWLAREGSDPAIAVIARLRTLSSLSALDTALDLYDLGENRRRKGYILRFLYEAGLIQGELPKIVLETADFSHAELFNFGLQGAHLRGVNLEEAQLVGADLRQADLSGAYLAGANLKSASLKGASFSGAVLDRADLTGTGIEPEQLNAAASRQGILL